MAVFDKKSSRRTLKRNFPAPDICCEPESVGALSKRHKSLSLNMKDLDPTSQIVSSVEALRMINDFRNGSFCGELVVHRHEGNSLAETASMVASTAPVINSFCSIGQESFNSSQNNILVMKRISDSSVPLFDKVLQRIHTEICTVDYLSTIPHGTKEKPSNIDAEILECHSFEEVSAVRNLIDLCADNGTSIKNLLNTEVICDQLIEDDILVEKKLIELLVLMFSWGDIFFYQRALFADDKFNSMKELAVYGTHTSIFFKAVFMAKRAVRFDLYEKVQVISSKFHPVYFACRGVEGMCPWVEINGEVNLELYDTIRCAIISLLHTRPGSTLRVIHSAVPILSLIQTNIMVLKLVDEGSVIKKEVQSTNVLSGPFWDSSSVDEIQSTIIFFTV